DVELDAPGITTTTLVCAPRYMAVPRGHPLATSTAVSLSDFAGDVWVMPVGASERSVQEANVVAACRRHGFEPRISHRATSIEPIRGSAASGSAVPPPPGSVALRPPPSVHLVRVADDYPHVVVAHPDGTVAAPNVERFVAAARTVVEALLADLER